MHEFQYDVAIARMKSREDLLLATLRQRLDVLEIRKLHREPDCCDLWAPDHKVSLFMPLRERQAQSLNIHEAYDRGSRVDSLAISRTW